MQRPQRDVQRTLGKPELGGELRRRDRAWVAGRDRREHRLLARSQSVIRTTSHRRLSGVAVDGAMVSCAARATLALPHSPVKSKLGHEHGEGSTEVGRRRDARKGSL